MNNVSIIRESLRGDQVNLLGHHVKKMAQRSQLHGNAWKANFLRVTLEVIQFRFVGTDKGDQYNGFFLNLISENCMKDTLFLYFGIQGDFYEGKNNLFRSIATRAYTNEYCSLQYCYLF